MSICEDCKKAADAPLPEGVSLLHDCFQFETCACLHRSGPPEKFYVAEVAKWVRTHRAGIFSKQEEQTT